MPENLNMNSLMKTILVLVIGFFALSLLFSFISGGGNMMGISAMGDNGHMAYMGYNNYSFTGLISGILTLLVKLLMLVLVIVVILGIAAWIKETMFKNSNLQILKSINSDPVLKSVTVVTLSILGLVLICAILNSFLQPGLNLNFYARGYTGGMYYGYNPAFGIAGLLAVLIRILTFILIISLILAVFVYLKKQYESGNLNFLQNNSDQNNDTIK